MLPPRWLLLLPAATAAVGGGQKLPNGYFWGCLNVSKGLPFCDASRPISERVADLVGRLTVKEKAGLLGPETKRSHVSACSDMDAGVPRLGIPGYTHLVETNTAAGSACVAPEKCATNFPGPASFGASFNRTLMRAKGEVISTEMRALNNIGWWRGYSAPHALIGVSGMGPNINIVRDPRFGRNSELPAEDPFLSGSYAMEVVKGIQEGPDPKYVKMVAGLKHFDAYSCETGRMNREFDISMFDLWDTYLPQYAMGFKKSFGGALATMCSYAGVNGVPMCANDYLLNKVVRGKWGAADVQVQSDCGAISNMVKGNHYAANNSDAAAKALNGGCDIDDGNQFYSPTENGGNGALEQALAEGLTTEAAVDAAVSRVLTNDRFRTGLADPIEGQVYMQIGADAINSTEHQRVNFEAAMQGMVLLKNDGVLPLQAGKSIAVVGPHAVSHRDLISDYPSDQLCYGGPVRGGDCWYSIGGAFAALHDAAVTVEKGVDLDTRSDAGVAAALAAAQAADQVVLCVGIGHDQEHEGIDRGATTLPGLQEGFAARVLALGKPTVLVLVNGGIVSIDALVGAAPAIVEAFYPSTRGGEALYAQLLGANRWGKLPVTIYRANYTKEVDLFDFNMSKPPGRTYRYYQGTPLFEFGFGLSLTQFHIACTETSHQADSTHLDCKVTNTGAVDGDEVLQIYHRVGAGIAPAHPVPRRALVDFARLSVAAGATATASFDLARDTLALTDLHGDRVVLAGTHYYDVTDGVAPPVTVTVNIQHDAIVEAAPRP